MTDPDQLIQIALGLLAVGGIGGIWYRLGALTARLDALDRRTSRLEARTPTTILTPVGGNFP